MGNCRKLTNYDTWSGGNISKESVVDEGYDSLLVLGNNKPDEEMDVKVKQGFCVPLGDIVAKNGDTRYRYLNHSEYIVYDENRVVIRYIVKIGSGKGRLDDVKDIDIETDDEDEEMDEEDEVASSISKSSSN